MYDPLETEISFDLLKQILDECKKRNITIAIIGGWATFYYVNKNYRRAFGKDYMGSRDIDVCFDPAKEKEFLKLITELGFIKNGYFFRWEKIYNRETKKFITEGESKNEQIYNLIKIFLDLFCNTETNILKSWCLNSLKDMKFTIIEGYPLTDIDTLIALKCTALFERDKADKENKDACDLYALIVYSGQKVMLTQLLIKSIEKMLSRSDLLYYISQHVLLDSGRQSIVQYVLRAKLEK